MIYIYIYIISIYIIYDKYIYTYYLWYVYSYYFKIHRSNNKSLNEFNTKIYVLFSIYHLNTRKVNELI